MIITFSLIFSLYWLKVSCDSHFHFIDENVQVILYFIDQHVQMVLYFSSLFTDQRFQVILFSLFIDDNVHFYWPACSNDLLSLFIDQNIQMILSVLLNSLFKWISLSVECQIILSFWWPACSNKFHFLFSLLENSSGSLMLLASMLISFSFASYLSLYVFLSLFDSMFQEISLPLSLSLYFWIG